MRTILLGACLMLSLAAQDRGRPSAPPTIETGQRDGHWYASTTVSRRGAAGIQVFLDDLRLPPAAELSLYELDSIGGKATRHATYTGHGPANGAGFWSASVPGPRILLEVVYGDLASAELPFFISDIRPVAPQELEVKPQPSSNAEDLVFFEGDIVLGPADSKSADQRSAMGITSTYYRWPNGVMPYVVDPALPNPQRIADAVSQWNAQLSATLRLVPRTTEAAWVRFVPTGGCYSYIGTTRQPDQPISIADWCGTGNVIHEIAHAAGLFHEQGREDRNQHIVILWENMGDPGNNFSQYISISDDIGAYDFGSIMHYPATAYSINGLPTMLTIPPGIYIGQRDGLSPGDLAAIQSMYAGSTPPPPPPPTQPTTVQVTVASNPPGLSLVVDGVTAISPVVRSWNVGSSHTVSAPSTTTGNTKYTFASWSDAGQSMHAIVAPSSALTLTATFGTQYRITATSSNAGLGSVSLSPNPADGFYARGSTVTATATGAGSGCLSSWSGITAPPASPLQLTASQPYSLTANFQTGAVSVSPSSISVPKNGGTFTIGVTANTGCAWSASTSYSWIQIGSGAGTGSGVVRFTVPRRTSRSSRTGNIRIGGATVTVRQSGY